QPARRRRCDLCRHTPHRSPAWEKNPELRELRQRRPDPSTLQLRCRAKTPPLLPPASAPSLRSASPISPPTVCEKLSFCWRFRFRQRSPTSIYVSSCDETNASSESGRGPGHEFD